MCQIGDGDNLISVCVRFFFPLQAGALETLPRPQSPKAVLSGTAGGEDNFLPTPQLPEGTSLAKRIPLPENRGVTWPHSQCPLGCAASVSCRGASAPARRPQDQRGSRGLSPLRRLSHSRVQA